MPSVRSVRGIRSAVALLSACASAPVVLAEDQPQSVTLQWFETDWNTIENRMPDFFVAGYSSVWLPPPSLASNASVGYDPFERFELGRPGLETFYGTSRDYIAMVEQFHRASAEVYTDTVLNHNGGRTGDQNFHAAGGWPGFWANWSGGNIPIGADWGDFHNGTTQSIDPGGFNYDLWQGDLVGLVDINQLSNNWTIRHPISADTPQGIQPSQSSPVRRIPEGTFRNRPDERHEERYPDRSLNADVINSPTNSRNSFTESGIFYPGYTVGSTSTTIHPFNTDPGAARGEPGVLPVGPASGDGDEVMENAAALLGRWCQYMLDVYRVDGFRIDAIKHTDPIFFDINFDRAVHNRRTLPDGSKGTPFSFGESTASDGFTNNFYIRKDGFGNRDALDLAGAGNIRNIINDRGGRFLGDIDNTHFDNVDGFNNGSLGLNHIYSHDNGTRGDGGSNPLWPYEDKMAPWAHSYVILRTGRAIVYLNGKSLLPNVGRFWPRRGVPSALGAGEFYTISPSNAPDGVQPPTTTDDRYTTLVRLRNQYGRGFYFPRAQNANSFVFERDGNMVVGLSDSYSAPVGGVYWQTVTVQTNFAPGTVLVELTGNHARPDVDPNDEIPETITVSGGGSVTLRIPNNVSTTREHSTGYVAYGPAAPSGTLTIANADDTVLPDDADTPTPIRRLTPLTVVRDDTFTIDLETTQTVASDPNTDNNALFRINQGYMDLNNNGQISRDETGPGEFEQYEAFLDVNQPLFTAARGSMGRYSQTINTDALPEGPNYLSVVAFRARPDGADPIINDFRLVLYVDRQEPDISVDAEFECAFASGALIITNTDATVTDVRVFPGVREGDHIPPVQQINIAPEQDRGVFRYVLNDITAPSISVAVVAIEDPGDLESGADAVNTTTRYLTLVTGIKGDVNLDGSIDSEDLYDLESLDDFRCQADLDADDDVDADDADALRALIRANETDDVLDER